MEKTKEIYSDSVCDLFMRQILNTSSQIKKKTDHLQSNFVAMINCRLLLLF